MRSEPIGRVIAALPGEPGVYRFRDDRGRATYLGRATDLRHRVASYWRDLGDRRHLRRMVPQVTRIEALPCDSVHEATWLERNLLETSKPRWNRVRGGLEVPTYVTLTRTATAARLGVVHSPVGAGVPGAPGAPDGTGVRTFGPYLGGTRSRLAVDGLDRALGLAYAGDRLGGFDRDMARVRGVSALERTARAELAAAALVGEPAALAQVTQCLVARRDEAAAALAFEVAAKIQAEIAALAWLTAPQRVTVDGGPDADVAGWCDGILVRLEVHGGRLTRWQERSVTRTSAAPLLEATPPAWADFAERAARQAAALRAAAAR